MRRVVTIDGPAGTGKSTVARLVAQGLGWTYLDTGAMYRAVALAALRQGIDPGVPALVEQLAAGLRFRFWEGRVELDGHDVTEEIRQRSVTERSGDVARYRGVRLVLTDWQRQFAEERDTVTEGRDQGTYVFPSASCKFFVTATAEERARRRYQQLTERGQVVTLAEVLAEQMQRDRQDEERTIAPLVAAADAVTLDTTAMPLQDVVDTILQRVHAVMQTQTRARG